MMRYTHKTEQPRSVVTACFSLLSFSNGCALILQAETLENVCRVKIHYLDMK